MPTSTFTKKYSFALGKNHMGKNVFAHNSTAGFTGVWSCTSPSLLSSGSFASLFSHFLTALPHSPSSQLSCVPALLAPGHLHSHSQAPLLQQLPLNLSGSLGFPCVPVPCRFRLLFQPFEYQMSSSTSLCQVTGHSNLHRSNTEFCWYTSFTSHRMYHCIQKLKGKIISELDRNLKTN